jgi:putative endonuclease
MTNWFVYIILTEKNRLYTGITTDVDRRFKEHSGDSAKGAKFFRSDKPLHIVFVEPCKNRSEASIKEAAIKKLTRNQKEHFIKEFASDGNKIYGGRKKKSNNLEGSSRSSCKRQ